MEDKDLIEALKLLDKVDVLRNVIAKGVMQEKDSEILKIAIDSLTLLDNKKLAAATNRLIIKGAYKNYIFDYCIKTLSKNAPSELKEVLKTLHETDKEFYENYVKDEDFGK